MKQESLMEMVGMVDVVMGGVEAVQEVELFGAEAESMAASLVVTMTMVN